MAVGSISTSKLTYPFFEFQLGATGPKGTSGERTGNARARSRGPGELARERVTAALGGTRGPGARSSSLPDLVSFVSARLAMA